MIERFGILESGEEVQAITLGEPGGLQAQVLTYGGILRRLVLPSRAGLQDLVIALPDLDAYVRDTSFQGIVAGRVANRVANACFELSGHTFQLTANDGVHQLHGGRLGFGKKLWKVLDLPDTTRQRLLLGLHSPAGEEGFPGNLAVTAEFTLEGAELRLRFGARCDEATPINLTWHPYFNLSGDTSRATDEMLLRIPASSYLPVRDSQLIPTGKIASVHGTAFDFRELRALRAPTSSTDSQLVYASGYDHCWVLDASRDCDAELVSPVSSVRMTVRSDRPGIQFYGGQHLAHVLRELNGVCLEPQGFPNAVNEPGFPSCIIRPEEAYSSSFCYRFESGRYRR
ncbi:MAG: aldose epimerase family protein [Gammaproteobacteria bacterium]